MNDLQNYNDLICTLFYVENPDTLQPEVIVRFTEFKNKDDAMHFVETFKSAEHFIDLSETQNHTIH